MSAHRAELRALAARVAAGHAASEPARDLAALSAVDRAEVYKLAWLPPIRRAEFEEASRRRLRRSYRRAA